MAQNIREVSIFAPMTGKIVDLTEVPDEAFSKKMMGDGVAIIPTDGMLYSPISGVVTAVAATKHAIGFQTNTGLDILVHVGLEAHAVTETTTILHVKEGQRVQAGDLVAEYDLGAFEEKMINPITPVVLVKEEEDGTEIKANVGDVEAGAGEIFKVVEIIAPEEPKEKPEPEEKPEPKKAGPDPTEAENSLMDLLSADGGEYFKDPKSLLKLGVVFISIVVVLAVVFALLALHLNGGE